MRVCSRAQARGSLGLRRSSLAGQVVHTCLQSGSGTPLGLSGDACVFAVGLTDVVISRPQSSTTKLLV